MAGFAGYLLKIEVGDGAATETFAVLAGIRSKTVTDSNAAIDTTHDGSVDANGVVHQSNTPGVKTHSISGEGILLSTTAFDTLQDDAEKQTLKNYRISYPNGAKRVGEYFVSEFSLAGSFDGEATYNIALSPTGPTTFTAAP